MKKDKNFDEKFINAIKFILELGLYKMLCNV